LQGTIYILQAIVAKYFSCTFLFKNVTNLQLLGIMHAAPPLAKSQLISSCSSKKCLAKIRIPTSQNDLQFIFTPDGWRMYPFNLPLPAPSCSWVPFQLSKHRLSNTFSQHQTPMQNYPSQPREDLKVSKSKRPRSLY